MSSERAMGFWSYAWRWWLGYGLGWGLFELLDRWETRRHKRRMRRAREDNGRAMQAFVAVMMGRGDKAAPQCPDCAVRAGEYHAVGCDRARCPITGRQQLICPQHGHRDGCPPWPYWGLN